MEKDNIRGETYNVAYQKATTSSPFYLSLYKATTIQSALSGYLELPILASKAVYLAKEDNT